MQRLGWLLAALCGVSLGALPCSAQLPGPEALAPAAGNREEIKLVEFENFAKLRDEVLNVIGGAKSRIWLLTDYLTDGEIVSALYVAQYRKLDVKVLLGRGKANAYMSRLGYLRQQNISVYLKPAGFTSGFPTQILTDDVLHKIDSDLNFLERQKKVRYQTGTKLEYEQFLKVFAEVEKAGFAPAPPPPPLVGHPRHDSQGKPYGGLPAPRPIVAAPPLPNYQGEQDGSFNYDRSRNARGGAEDLPRKLPRKTILESKQAPPPPPPPPAAPPAKPEPQSPFNHIPSNGNLPLAEPNNLLEK